MLGLHSATTLVAAAICTASMLHSRGKACFFQQVLRQMLVNIPILLQRRLMQSCRLIPVMRIPLAVRLKHIMSALQYLQISLSLRRRFDFPIG